MDFGVGFCRIAAGISKDYCSGELEVNWRVRFGGG